MPCHFWHSQPAVSQVCKTGTMLTISLRGEAVNLSHGIGQASRYTARRAAQLSATSTGLVQGTNLSTHWFPICAKVPFRSSGSPDARPSLAKNSFGNGKVVHRRQVRKGCRRGGRQLLHLLLAGRGVLSFSPGLDALS